MQPNIRLVRLPLGTRYALQGMILLARRREGEYRLVEEIAKEGRLPRNFLSKIFQDLARAGLLNSRRGRGGGYCLRRQPEKIRLMEIIDAVNDPVPEQSMCLLRPYDCKGDEPCLLHNAVVAWEEVMIKRLQDTTLAEALADGLVKRTAA